MALKRLASTWYGRSHWKRISFSSRKNGENIALGPSIQAGTALMLNFTALMRNFTWKKLVIGGGLRRAAGNL